MLTGESVFGDQIHGFKWTRGDVWFTLVSRVLAGGDENLNGDPAIV